MAVTGSSRFRLVWGRQVADQPRALRNGLPVTLLADFGVIVLMCAFANQFVLWRAVSLILLALTFRDLDSTVRLRIASTSYATKSNAVAGGLVSFSMGKGRALLAAASSFICGGVA